MLGQALRASLQRRDQVETSKDLGRRRR